MPIDEIVGYVLKTPFNTNKAILTEMLSDLQKEGGGEITAPQRDNDYNYNKVADTYVPARGKICFVDTARDGLRVKVGDGVTVWKDLEYADEFIIKGYYYEGNFYKDKDHTKLLSGAIQKIYIDLAERTIYFYDGERYISAYGNATQIEPATEEKAGITKLYQTIGNNSDGTMSQKAIADELDNKIEIALNVSEELLIFTQS